MADKHTQNYQKVPLQVTHGYLVASIQVYLDEHMLAGFRDDLLSEIRDSDIDGVILDVSGVSIIDRTSFASLMKIRSMISLMGTRSVLVGIKAGVAASLIDLDVDLSRVDAVLQLEDAFELFDGETGHLETIEEEIDTEPDEEQVALIDEGAIEDE
ncbi:MAG: hypothetical protein COB20_02700 [SAR86 cluster bacterium]|uniref:STAS domain-containing protein n=1 Tax=SAR86 cluster bacterium TaxID=2030880 RepID=A0A2A4XDP2_9GAMM|nr:MAG: hypothetical protein COB20_02700 [SAR86 cluster bacterium]